MKNEDELMSAINDIFGEGTDPGELIEIIDAELSRLAGRRLTSTEAFDLYSLIINSVSDVEDLVEVYSSIEFNKNEYIRSSKIVGVLSAICSLESNKHLSMESIDLINDMCRAMIAFGFLVGSKIPD